MPIVSLTEVSRQLWINWGLNGPPPHSHVWTPRLYWCHSVLALVSQPQPWPLIGECQSRPVTINYTWRCPWPKTNPGLATEAFRLFGTKPITRKTNDPSYSNCDSGIDLARYGIVLKSTLKCHVILLNFSWNQPWPFMNHTKSSWDHLKTLDSLKYFLMSPM